MIQCQNCGQANADESQFCRFCGNRISASEAQFGFSQQGNYQPVPPRPYAWKTDEYQTQSERRINSGALDNINSPYSSGQPMVYSGGQPVVGNYRCPNCGTAVPPVTERRISTAGWVVFAALLVFTFIFFWIGLLMKENVNVCPVCRVKLG